MSRNTLFGKKVITNFMGKASKQSTRRNSSNPKKPKVTVVIPTKNRADSIPGMLDSLIKQKYKKFEVVIVDGGSTDKTKEVVESYKNKLSIRFFVKKGGLVKQINEGLKKARGELFLRTDDDAEYSSQTIQEIVKTFKIASDIGGVSGPTLTKDMDSRDLFLFQKKFKKGNLFWRSVGKFYYDFILEGGVAEMGKFARSGAPTLGANYLQALRLKEPVEVEQNECITYCLKTDLLRKVGGFDERYGKVGEYHEVDATFKVRKLGYRIMLNPKAYAYHHTSKSGVFSARADSFDRIVNFINFYFWHIKPNRLDKAIRFLAYVLFQDAYYFYMFLKQRKIALLGCFPATIYALVKNSLKKESWRGGMK